MLIVLINRIIEIEITSEMQILKRFFFAKLEKHINQTKQHNKKSVKQLLSRIYTKNAINEHDRNINKTWKIVHFFVFVGQQWKILMEIYFSFISEVFIMMMHFTLHGVRYIHEKIFFEVLAVLFLYCDFSTF